MTKRSHYARYDAFERHADRETLERVKRWPQLMTRFKLVRIYSAEHVHFWYRSGQGYTPNPCDSDKLPMKEAFDRTSHCGPEKMIQYVCADDTTADSARCDICHNVHTEVGALEYGEPFILPGKPGLYCRRLSVCLACSRARV
jgi:hypothetical protein